MFAPGFCSGSCVFCQMCCVASEASLDHFVVDPTQLESVINQASAGDTIYLSASAEPYDIQITAYNNPATGLTFASADADDPASVRSLKLHDTSDIIFDGVNFDVPTSAGDLLSVITIRDATDITISNAVMTGSATEALTAGGGAQVASNLTNISHVDGLTMTGNTITGFNFGIAVLEGTDVTITDNDISQLQGDPIRMGGVKDVEISGNYIHDLIGSDAAVNHMDMIQFWSTNTQIVNENILIEDNVLDAGDGVAAQSIFMRNEKYDRSHDPDPELMYQNITIQNNVIYNGDSHGITVGETNGLNIANNTMISHPYAQVMGNDATIANTHPAINVADASTGVSITDNLTQKINAPDGASQSGNLLVNYDDPKSDAYYAKIFMDPMSEAVDVFTDLLLSPTSAALEAGVGASLSNPLLSAHAPEICLNHEAGEGLLSSVASFSMTCILQDGPGFDMDTTHVSWDFGDGNTGSGFGPSHVYSEPGLYVVTATIHEPGSAPESYEMTIEVIGSKLFEIDPGADIEAGNSVLSTTGAVDMSAGADGDAIALNNGHIRFATDNTFTGNDAFSLVTRFQRDDAHDDGHIVFFSGTTTLMVRHGELRAFVVTDEGMQMLRAPFAGDDVDMHVAAVTFSGVEGEARLYLDGEVVDMIDGLDGQVQVGSSQDNFYLGSPYNQSFEGLIKETNFVNGALSDAQVQSLADGASFDEMLLAHMQSQMPDSDTAPEGVYHANYEPEAQAEAQTSSAAAVSEPSLTLSEVSDPYADYNVIYGDDGDNPLRGTDGNDYLIGGDGRDNINGGAGDDIIEAGTGNDWYVLGGSGADTFRFSYGDGDLRLHDFKSGVDTIELRDGMSFEELKFSIGGDGKTLIYTNSQGDRLMIGGKDAAPLVESDFTISDGQGAGATASQIQIAQITQSLEASSLNDAVDMPAHVFDSAGIAEELAEFAFFDHSGSSVVSF